MRHPHAQRGPAARFGPHVVRPASRHMLQGLSRTKLGRLGGPRSRARSSGRFRRLQSWASTMRKLLTWGYVAADSASRGGEPEKPHRTPEGRQIRARFPAKRPRTWGVAALERSGAQAVSREAAQSARFPLLPLSLPRPDSHSLALFRLPFRTLAPFAPYAPVRPPRPVSPLFRPDSLPFHPLFAGLFFFRLVRLQFRAKRLLR